MKPHKSNFLLFTFCFSIIYAMPLAGQSILKQKSFGGDNEDYAADAKLTRDKGYLIASTSMSGISGDKTENNFGDFDYWIIKTNKESNIEWQRTMGGDKQDYPRSVLETKDAGFLIGGSSLSGVSGNKTVGNQGDSDFWLIKFDKDGKEQWQKGYGGKNVDELVVVLENPKGGYLLAGYAWFEPTAQKGRYDYWVVMIDEKGEMKWEQSIGGPHDDILTDAIVDHAGNIVLTGYSLSGALGDKTEPCLGFYDFWTVCMNTDRKILWQKTLGTDKEDRTENILQDKNQAYHIGGGSPLNEGVQSIDFYIAILNAKGEYQRKIQTGGDQEDFALTIFQSFDNGIMYGGYSASGKSGDKSENSYGDKDGWIIKYDSAGKKIWDKGIGGEKLDVINRIVPHKRNCYNLLMTSQSGISGNLTQKGRGLSDVLMITLKDKKG